VVPPGWNNLLKQAQEQPGELWPALPGSACFTGSGPLRYCFPVAGPFSFRDTWGEPRSGGRVHRAVDIFAPEGSPVYAITSGVIASLATLPEAGITLILRGQDGKGYGYMHLQGYAAGLAEGKVVRTGELIGYVGRTGIQSSAAHLHLQVYADQRFCKDDLLNPYGFLVQLCHGVGVTDLNQPKMARLENPEIRVRGIKVYRRSKSAALRAGLGQFSVKNSSITVIENF
jgi:murein DD-endopeptidase MepM/ murein hydrolase activator NlpD